MTRSDYNNMSREQLIERLMDLESNEPLDGWVRVLGSYWKKEFSNGYIGEVWNEGHTMKWMCQLKNSGGGGFPTMRTAMKHIEYLCLHPYKKD